MFIHKLQADLVVIIVAAVVLQILWWLAVVLQTNALNGGVILSNGLTIIQKMISVSI